MNESFSANVDNIDDDTGIPDQSSLALPGVDSSNETPRQAQLPFAVVDGQPIMQLPEDLYIPPDALEVFLEAFEGPLDLLLYLIKRQNLDILNVPIAQITYQYTQYIEVMQELQLELAGEYLVMAAMLAEIKSRMLLPRPISEEEDEDDPRAELIRRLQEYERYKKAAEDIDGLERLERDVRQAQVEMCERKVVEMLPELTMKELLLSFRDVMTRAEMYAHHHIQLEPLSVRQRMSDVLSRLESSEFQEFSRLFDPTEGRIGVVVTFLAVLELIREKLIDLVQNEPFAPIHVKVRDRQETHDGEAVETEAAIEDATPSGSGADGQE
ncbi:MAG: segregation/condensation protein A [Gammaproteobacteria bacterium]|nr:MAG: segregation/condensation protein A [Gammaproteobacteria bacterium]